MGATIARTKRITIMEDTIFLFFLLLKSNIIFTHLFIILPYCGLILSPIVKFPFGYGIHLHS